MVAYSETILWVYWQLFEEEKTNMNICNFFLADKILGSFFPPHNDENCTILREHFQDNAMYNWEFFAQNSSTPSVCMSSQT